MSFEVSADDYLRFIGAYSLPLATRFADLAGVGAGQRVLDVGCGPGTLTAELVSRTGAAGDYVGALTQEHRDELRERCRRLLPDGPVEISATAWAATGRPAPAGTS